MAFNINTPALPPLTTLLHTHHTNMSEQNKKIIALFDVDGTLTIARGEVKPEMNDFLAELRQKIVIGTVGGSDFVKQKEQLGDDVQSRFDYCFAENGLTALFGEETLGSQSFREYLGEDKLRELINFILGYLAKLVDVPVKRGTVRQYFFFFFKCCCCCGCVAALFLLFISLIMICCCFFFFLDNYNAGHSPQL